MRGGTLKAFIVFIIVFALIALGAWLLAPRFVGELGGAGRERVALIYIEGMISGGRASGAPFLGESGASSVAICEQLYRARDDDSIKAVLLRVNSPGGAAAASDEIYRAVKAVRDGGKPVVVSMGDVAASGGYYVSAPADYIFASGATLTGSIGVIFSLFNWEEAAAKLGIDDMTLTSGEYKDIGSPWREMTEAERAMLEELMDEVHDQFIAAVAAGRANLSEEQVREIATGMIYTGERAVELGLVDELGGMRAAEDKARELAGLAARAPIEEYCQRSLWDELFSISADAPGGAGLLRRLGADPLLRLAGSMYVNPTLRDLVVR